MSNNTLGYFDLLFYPFSPRAPLGMYYPIHYADEENRYPRCNCGSVGGASDALGRSDHTHACTCALMALYTGAYLGTWWLYI